MGWQEKKEKEKKSNEKQKEVAKITEVSTR